MAAKASKQQVQDFDSFLIDQITDHKTDNADLHTRAAINVGGLLSRVKVALEAASPGIIKVLQVADFAAPQYKPLFDAAIALVLAGGAAMANQPAS